jgi:outer membrane protein insertion porin family
LLKLLSRKVVRFIKLTSLLAFILYPLNLSAQAYKFSKLVINGNLNIERQTIESFINLDISKSVTASALNRAYQRIFDSGLFKSVEILPKNTELKITVEEFPLIKSISFEGNKKIKKEQLSDIISSKQRFSLSPSKTDNDADLIVEAYRARGLIGASVTPKIVNRPNNLVDLIFEIVEGKVTEVERVSFVGNFAYSDRRLRRVLASKQAGLLRRLFSSDTFVADSKI